MVMNTTIWQYELVQPTTYTHLKIPPFDRLDIEIFDILVNNDCRITKAREAYYNNVSVDVIKIIVLLNCCFVNYI